MSQFLIHLIGSNGFLQTVPCTVPHQSIVRLDKAHMYHNASYALTVRNKFWFGRNDSCYLTNSFKHNATTGLSITRKTILDITKNVVCSVMLPCQHLPARDFYVWSTVDPRRCTHIDMFFFSCQFDAHQAKFGSLVSYKMPVLLISCILCDI
jgi:hypothetical protein